MGCCCLPVLTEEEERKEKEEEEVPSNWRQKGSIGRRFLFGGRVFGQRAQKLSFVQTRRIFFYEYHISILMQGGVCFL